MTKFCPFSTVKNHPCRCTQQDCELWNEQEVECSFKTGMLSIDRLGETIALFLSQQEDKNEDNNS